MPIKPLSYAQRRRATTPRKGRTVSALAKGIRSSGRWTKYARWHKRMYPLCCDPFGYHERDRVVTPNQHVHHVVSVNEAPELAFDVENTAGLCIPCHMQIEAMVKRGQETAHLFAKWRESVASL